MNRLYILLGILYCGILSSFSQELTIKSVTWKESDLSATKRSVLDNNLDTCALVKVFTNIPDMTFEGNVVDTHKSATCYWVYVTSGTRSLTVHHRSLLPSEINAQQHDVFNFKGGRTYYVTTSVPMVIEEMLRGDFTRVKMTRERKEMIRLDTQYRIADSLYRKASETYDRDAKKRLLEASSDYGWPLATIELTKLKEPKSSYVFSMLLESYLSGDLNLEESKLTFQYPEMNVYPKIKAQYEQLDRYLDWLYHELKPFDEILRGHSSHVYKIESASSPSNEELLIREMESKIKSYKKAIERYNRIVQRPFRCRNSVEGFTVQGTEIIERDMPFVPIDREETYLFYQIKRLWFDIVKLAKRLPSASFLGIDVAGL